MPPFLGLKLTPGHGLCLPAVKLSRLLTWLNLSSLESAVQDTNWNPDWSPRCLSLVRPGRTFLYWLLSWKRAPRTSESTVSSAQTLFGGISYCFMEWYLHALNTRQATRIKKFTQMPLVLGAVHDVTILLPAEYSMQRTLLGAS